MRAGGIEPPLPLRANGFSCPLRLSPPRRRRVWGLDYPFALANRLRRCPSSLYTFPPDSPAGLARDCHLTGFPEFGQFYVPGFPERTQVDQVRRVYRFRHARCADSAATNGIIQAPGAALRERRLNGQRVARRCGGWSRNRTGVHGVAVRCITTLPSSRNGPHRIRAKPIIAPPARSPRGGLSPAAASRPAGERCGAACRWLGRSGGSRRSRRARSAARDEPRTARSAGSRR